MKKINAPIIDARAYMCLTKTEGTLIVNTSRIIPPPTPVIVPTNNTRKILLPYPLLIATEAPLTVNTPKPIASDKLINISKNFIGLVTRGELIFLKRKPNKKIVTVTKTAIKYIGSLNTDGGVIPKVISLIAPPAVAVTIAIIVIPNISISFFTPARVPETAKAIVPNISKINIVVLIPISSPKKYNYLYYYFSKEQKVYQEIFCFVFLVLRIKIPIKDSIIDNNGLIIFKNAYRPYSTTGTPKVEAINAPAVVQGISAPVNVPPSSKRRLSISGFRFLSLNASLYRVPFRIIPR